MDLQWNPEVFRIKTKQAISKEKNLNMELFSFVFFVGGYLFIYIAIVYSNTEFVVLNFWAFNSFCTFDEGSKNL